MLVLPARTQPNLVSSAIQVSPEDRSADLATMCQRRVRRQGENQSSQDARSPDLPSGG